ncbi:hypothetical protein QOZ80_9AG0684280 [Eleusine coracana subsp. coracana]|nr:hypothetical protein QOZ80_9AG0684280 [Eleusine coracana subsp. coracana]
MASTAAAGTVMILLVAAAAASTAANKVWLPKSSQNLASVSSPKPPSKWSPSASVVRPKPSTMTASPPASATCVTSLLDLSSCLSFFKDAAATAAPPGCCEGLRAIIGTQAMCLCHIVNHSLERAIGVDIPINRAFQLLGDICSLALPPEVITSCGEKGPVLVSMSYSANLTFQQLTSC